MNMLAIINGKVLTAAEKEYPSATILVKDGKIAAVGEDLEIPEDAQFLDASGCWVTPGLIDAHTHIGTCVEPAVRHEFCDDNEETADPATPQLRSLDSFNLHEPGIEAARRAGFTSCCSLPGSGNVIGGQGFAFKTASRSTVDEMVIPGTAVMKCALGENPIDAYGKRGLTPVTRMGIAGVLRQTLYEAKIYSDKLLEAEQDPSVERPTPSFKLDAMVPVVRGEMKCRIHCHSGHDIATALRIAEEFHLNIVLEHTTEGFMMADEIAERHVPCVVGPLAMGPVKREVWNRTFKNPAVLVHSGVEIALTQDSDQMTCMLPVYVGIAIKHGLTPEEALRATTITPARILGVDHRTGSIEVGKDADLAIFDGDPFSNYTSCRYTVIDGVVYCNE